MKENRIKLITSKIIVFINCVLLCFICVRPVRKVQAEAGTIAQGKNVLLTILGYMGVELVGTAAVIDQYVQQGWQLFLNGLSEPFTQEAYTLTAIAGMVQWDDVNNVLSVPKDLYNLVSQWAQELSNQFGITSSSENLNIGEVEIPVSGGNVLPSVESATPARDAIINNGFTFYRQYYNSFYVGTNSVIGSYAFYQTPNNANLATICICIPKSEYDRINQLDVKNVRGAAQSNNTTVTYTKTSSFREYNEFYYTYTNETFQKTDLLNYNDYTLYPTLADAVNAMASGGTLLDNVYVNGNSNLDDRIFSTDNGAQLELDPAVPAGATFTLDQVLEAVLDWAISDTWPDDLAISDSFPIAIPDAIDTVILPLAPFEPVPTPLLPENLPIIFNPECESFSACLVSGIQAVSADITQFYNSSEAVRNYANIILYIGLSFVALGVIRRHL